MGLSEKISEAEWAVMSVLWQQHPLPAAKVVTALWEEKGWSLTTVRTLLARLVKKGAVGAQLEGRRYLYEPRINMDTCIKDAGRSLVERFAGTSASSMVINMVKETELSKEEIKELKRILRDKEK